MTPILDLRVSEKGKTVRIVYRELLFGHHSIVSPWNVSDFLIWYR